MDRNAELRTAFWADPNFVEATKQGMEALDRGECITLDELRRQVDMVSIETRLAGAKKADGAFFFPDDTGVRLQCMCRGHRDHDSKVTAHKLARINRMDSCSGFSGWTASKDLAVWLAAVAEMGHGDVPQLMPQWDHDGVLSWIGDFGDFAEAGGTPLEATLATLLAAVQAKGAEVPEYMARKETNTESFSGLDAEHPKGN